MKKKLEELMRNHTIIRKDGFSIKINEEKDLWNKCIMSLGKKDAYSLMAILLNEIYKENYQEDYIFSNDCMAYEIGYHANAYFKLMGYRGYHRHLLTYLLTKRMVIEHCEIIDISTYDLGNKAQKYIFGYKKGIRECYKGTDRDPFMKHD